MATRVLRGPDDIQRLAAFVGTMPSFPMTVTITKGDNRRNAQNRLAQRWFSDIARQLGDVTHDEVRAECKVTHGVQILRAENEAFRQSWDSTFGRLDYGSQREAVKNLDVPVTRLMTVKQMTKFMDAVHSFWASRGFALTDPEALKYEAEFGGAS